MDLAEFNVIEWYMLTAAMCLIACTSRMQCKKSIQYGRNCEVVEYKKTFSIFVVALVFSVLAAFRSGIGDTPIYIRHYYSMSANPLEVFKSLPEDADHGYYILASLIKSIFGNNATWYLGLIAFCSFFPIFRTFERVTGSPALCIAIFFLSGSVLASLNGMRQTLAGGLYFAWCISLLDRKRYLRYIVICILLSTIHTSAVILIPIVFLMDHEPWGKKTWIMLGVILLMYIAYPIYARILTFLISDTRYSGYSEKILAGNIGANIIRSLVALVPLGLSFYLDSDLREERFYPICVKMSVINFGFMLLASARSWIIARMCIYTGMFSTALLVLCIKHLPKNLKAIIKPLCIILYGVYFIIDTGIAFI